MMRKGMIRRTAFRRTPAKPKAPGGDRRALEDMKLGELERLLDAELSLWVRGNLALKMSGIIPCYTCGSYFHWKVMDAGHYIGRANRGVRWELHNIRPQCTKCNCYEEGQHYKFRANLVIELGDEAVLDLERIADLYGATKMPREWLVEQIRSWRRTTLPLRKELLCLG